MVSENMERLGMKKCTLKSGNVPTYTGGLQTKAQSVEVESVTKTSQTKETKTLHLNGLSKVPLLSDSERKQDNSPLVKNLNSVPKNCRRKISVDELPGNLHWMEDNDKENFEPAVEQLEKCSSANKKIIFQHHSLHCKISTNYRRKACFGHQSVRKLENASMVGMPSQELVLQENSAAGTNQDVYDFDEDDMSSNAHCKKKKKRKKVESSDDEYIPSKMVRKPPKSVSSKTSNAANKRVRINRKVVNSVCKSRTGKSALQNLVPKIDNGSTKQALCDLDGCSSSVLPTGQPVTNINEISTSSDLLSMSHDTVNFSNMAKSCIDDKKLHLKPIVHLKRLKHSVFASKIVGTSFAGATSINATTSDTNSKESNATYRLTPSLDALKVAAYVSPKTSMKRNSSIEATFNSAFKTVMHNRMANFCMIGDSSHDFKGFSSSEYVCTFNNKISEDHNALCSSTTFGKTEKKMFEAQTLTVQGENGLQVSDDVVVENGNSCEKFPSLEKTNIASNIDTGCTADFPVMNDLHVQSESSKMKETCGRHTFSLTYPKKISNDDGKLHLKPVVHLKRPIQPCRAFSSDKECSGKETMVENVNVLDSNKENIPTTVRQSISKTWRQSKNSRRPAAYVSPKAYIERDDSIEDLFDLPLRFTSENCSADLGRNEDAASKNGGNSGEIGSSRLSGCVTDSGRMSACQETSGASISSINSQCATSNQIGAHREGVASIVSCGASKDSVCAGERFSVATKSDARSSDCMSNILTKSVDDSEGTVPEAPLSDVHSISVSSVRNDSVDNACKPRIEIRASRGMTCGNDVGTDQLGECNKDNCFGFDQEEPEEELLSPIKLQTFAQQTGLNIMTSSTPDHGAFTVKQKVEPWRLHRFRVPTRWRTQGQATMHSFLSKSAPQPKRDASAMVESETVASKSLHHQVSEETRKVAAAVSTPAIFSVPAAVDLGSSFNRQPARRVYSYPKRTKKCNLESLQEDPVADDEGENISRKVSKKRSKKQVKNDQNMKRFLDEVSKEFEQIENFELCVE